MHDKQKTQCIVFDLGNVLVELKGFPWFEAQDPTLSQQSIHRKWLELESVREFETGKISEPDFFKRIISELKLKEDPDVFAQRYRDWVAGFYPEAEALLLNLKKHYQIACLSNTNSFHIRHLNQQANTLSLFDYSFLSYEMGFIKPDPSAFQYVLNRLRLPAEKLLFVDDNLDNVYSAQKLGFNAHHVIGFESLKTTLQDQGITE